MAQEIYFTQDIMKPKDVKNNSRKRDYQEANLEQLDILNLVKAHESKIGRLDELDTVQDNMSKIADEHASTLAKISDLTTKVSSMDNKHKTTSKSVKQLTETTSNIQGEITDVSAQLETTKDDLEAKQGELNIEISSVSTKIESFEQKFEEMHNEIQRLKDELEAQKSKGFFGFLRRMFTWKKKTTVVTEDENIEESSEENKEEVTLEPIAEKNEAKDIESEVVVNKSSDVEKNEDTEPIVEGEVVEEQSEDSSDKEWLPGSN